MKKCSNCNIKLDDNSKYCPLCGDKVDNQIDDKKIKMESKYIEKKKTSFGDVIRYILGGIFYFTGFLMFAQGDVYGLLYIIFGLSWFPLVYNSFLVRFVKDKGFMLILQILIPLSLFVLIVLIAPSNESNLNNNDYSNTSSFNHETEKEKVLKSVRKNLSSFQSIISYDENTKTGNFDFKIKENKTTLNAYTCASDSQYLVEKIAGLKYIGNIEFECVKSNQTIYYVTIENVSSLIVDNISDSTFYFDEYHNSVNTNIETLKENAIKDYKKECASFGYKDVLRNPEEYNGKQAYWFGKIVQVVDKDSLGSIFRIQVNCQKYSYLSGYYCDDAIYVSYYGDQSFIEDDMVKMWGIMDGNKTYTTVLGSNLTIPKFHAVYMELQ